MALVGRSPIKVTAAPSTAPQEAMAASLQAHIDDLVQKNRTCEHTIKKLQQALADEKERGIEAVSRMKHELQWEREEWREGCDSLLASHRIVHIRTRIELDKERLNVQLEKEENRRERINILHRDYRLTLFQAKESDLEAKVGTLEDALEDLLEEREQDAQEYLERIAALEKELNREERARKQSDQRLETREADFASLQSEVSSLRKENATLKTSSESASTKLERTELQLEGMKSNLTELESANAELKRTNADLKRQLDRWQTLETKGGTEMEEARKRRIELEVEVKELQSRVKELEKAEKEATRALDRERSKVDKLKKGNDRMAEVAQQAQDLAKKAQDDYDEATKRLRIAQRQMEKLKIGRTKGKKLAHEIELPASDAEPDSIERSEREVEKTLAPALKNRVRAGPLHRRKDIDEEQESAEEQIESSAEQAAVGAPATESIGRGRRRKKDEKAIRKPKDNDVVQSGDEEPSNMKEKEIRSKSVSELEPRPQKNGRTSKRNKGNQDNANDSKTNTKGQTIDYDETENTALLPSSQSKMRKPSSSQGPRIKIVDSTDETEAQPKKKKKRLFPPSQTETFPWDVLPKGEGFAGLNIPTQLSPVKETEAVPVRSVFGKMGSALGIR